MTNGVTTGALSDDPLDYCILAAGTAVAWVYAIELNIIIFVTFKRKGGLYFWSLLISSWGLALHALGFILKFLVGTSWLVDIPMITTGWVAMVTGQAFVLYSRLHLVVRNPRILRYVLYLILFGILALHIPTVIFTYGSNSPSAISGGWTSKFNVMERIQLAGFCIQETIISATYVWSTVRTLRSIYHTSTRKVMMQLILINCICIGMDVILICLEYTNKYIGEASIKPMIYAIKLKLEFTILNQLMSITKAGLTEGNRWRGGPSHELREQNPASCNSDGLPPSAKVGLWNSAIAVRDAPVESRPEGASQDPNEIYKTQQIQVVSETIDTLASPSHSPKLTPSSRMVSFNQQKAKSLMGTTQVYGSARVARSPRPDPARNRSPTESEEDIIRDSSDIEKATR